MSTGDNLLVSPPIVFPDSLSDLLGCTPFGLGSCTWLVVEPTPLEKYATVKLGSNLPQFFGGENSKKCLSCHHLDHHPDCTIGRYAFQNGQNGSVFFLRHKTPVQLGRRFCCALRYHTLQAISAMWRPNSMAFGLVSRPKQFCIS